MMPNGMGQDVYWGKYRGKVTDNKDPQAVGRIQATVPAIVAEPLNWAMPCTPYAGPQVGFFTMPPIGANVWIEFEGGDPNYPIWSGCFWGSDQKQKPPIDAVGPEVKVLQTDKLALILNDQESKLTARLKDSGATDAVQMGLEMDPNSIIITAKQVTVTITPDKVEIKKGATVIEMTDDIKLTKPPATIEITSNITLTNAATSAELSSSAIDLKNSAASISMSPASVSVNNGALEVI